MESHRNYASGARLNRMASAIGDRGKILFIRNTHAYAGEGHGHRALVGGSHGSRRALRSDLLVAEIKAARRESYGRTIPFEFDELRLRGRAVYQRNQTFLLAGHCRLKLSVNRAIRAHRD
jgi:hypothetical protein